MKKVKLTMIDVLIVMSAMTKIPKKIPAFALPAYEEKYGKNCVVNDKFTVEVDEINPEVEAQRLIRALGVEDETKQSYFEIAFGRGRAGLTEFQKAVKSATKAVKAPAKKAAKEDPPPPPAGEPEGDPIDE